MKKGFLAFIIICLLLLAAGITILVIGLKNGGSIIFNIDFTKGIIKTKANETITEGSVDVDEFKNISVDIHAGEVKLVKGSSFNVKYSLYEEDIPDIKVDGGTLKVVSKKKNDFFQVNTGVFTNNDSDKLYVEITVPDGTEFGNVTINDSYGKITLDSFVFDTLTIDSDAGDVNFCSVTSEKVEVNVDYGNLEITGSTIDDMTVDCDAGNVEVSDSKIDNIEINNDYGDVDIDLNAEKADYYIDIDVDYGNLSVDGNKYKNSFSENKGKDKSVIINSDAGDVDLQFK